MTATLFPVAKLTENEDYNHINHVAHTDNWYTHPAEVDLLLTRGIHSNGTVKINRKGLPKNGKFAKKGKAMMPKGSVKCMVNAAKTMYFTAWQDNKPVHMLSSFKPYLLKIKRKSSADGWRRVEIDSHSLIRAYNYGMGGTDRMDQLNSYYLFIHKGIRWTHRLISHFLGISVLNAHILYNMSNNGSRLSSIEFFDSVIKALVDLEKTNNWDLGQNGEVAEPVLAPVVPMDPEAPVVVEEAPAPLELVPKVKGKVFRRNRRLNQRGELERLEGIHSPLLLDSKNRRRCVFHPNIKQRFYCPTCDVALCPSATEEDCCWYKYHHEETWKDI